jgi:hypothetical protein
VYLSNTEPLTSLGCPWNANILCPTRIRASRCGTVCEFQNQPQKKSSQTFQKWFWYQKSMQNPEIEVPTFFDHGLFKKYVFVTKHVLFLVNNCILAKNKSQSAIFDQKQTAHILSQKVIFEKGHEHASRVWVMFVHCSRFT